MHESEDADKDSGALCVNTRVGTVANTENKIEHVYLPNPISKKLTPTIKTIALTSESGRSPESARAVSSPPRSTAHACHHGSWPEPKSIPHFSPVRRVNACTRVCGVASVYIMCEYGRTLKRDTLRPWSWPVGRAQTYPVLATATSD